MKHYIIPLNDIHHQTIHNVARQPPDEMWSAGKTRRIMFLVHPAVSVQERLQGHGKTFGHFARIGTQETSDLTGVPYFPEETHNRRDLGKAAAEESAGILNKNEGLGMTTATCALTRRPPPQLSWLLWSRNGKLLSRVQFPNQGKGRRGEGLGGGRYHSLLLPLNGEPVLCWRRRDEILPSYVKSEGNL